MVLLKGGGTFMRWSVVGGPQVTEGMQWEGTPSLSHFAFSPWG
jgi:hypothetical protein